MFAFVTKKAATAGKAGLSSAHLLVDVAKSYWLERAESENHFVKMHCYHYENLATTVREYRTLKMCEFFSMAPILLNPSQALQNKALMLQNHKETLEAIGVETKAKTNALGLEEGWVPM